MKKVMLILMLSVFALGSSGFKSDETDCVGYAAEQATEGAMWLQDHGYETNMFTAFDLYLEFFDDCENGITGDAVWIAG